MRAQHYAGVVAACALAANVLAQTATTQEPAVLSPAASSSYERRDTLPNVNIYLPEGEASLRLRRLIRNALFETQIDYKFVSGDISTFLRYKYYSRNYTYRIGIFDTIEFPELGEQSDTEFERVRGGLLLVGIPRDYNRRFLLLLQNDRLTFGDLTNVDNKKNNIYTKIGYQFGTQFDERLNSIVGETRGRITPVLTAFRDIGPQKTGFAVALTQSSRFATGDYQYTKIQGEVLRRFDISERSFVFSRLHIGSFFGYDRLDDREDCSPDSTGRIARPDIECYSVPRYDMFRLGGRDALASIDTNEFTQGLQEVHFRNELFVPIFRNRDYKTWLLHWNTLYGIAYAGAGTVGFKRDQLLRTNEAVVDAGIGFEASLMARDDFEVLFSMLYSHTLAAPCERTEEFPDARCLEGQNWKFSVRTIR